MTNYQKLQERNALLRSHAYKTARLAKLMAADQGDLAAAKELLRTACDLSMQAMSIAWTGGSNSGRSITQHAGSMRVAGTIDRIAMNILETIDVDVQAIKWPVLLKVWQHLDGMSTPTFQREPRAVQWPDERTDSAAGQTVGSIESEVSL